ncbi:MAG: CinA family protein [Erysipelotrichaceae bacterium]|nr:CinA family protein [Erysipelotrichaceae bacterium]MBR2700716.1 CinA family protein [Erysipelotrichaceae bacterium]MBR2745496.1 CinA family protein [Erysipelotrichaceae bacterium]
MGNEVTKQLVDRLLEKHYTIASCESLTGGLFASTLAEIPGVSGTLKGGVVTYWTEIKEKVAGVSAETIANHGVVSTETANEMAAGIMKLFATDVAVSFTGNAGPDVMEGKPAGLVYTCIIIKDRVYEFCDQIDLPRNELRQQIVNTTIKRIKENL